MAAATESRSHSRGRGRGRPNKVLESLRIPGASNMMASTPSAAISKVITQMIGLNETEITKIILPLVEGMITSAEDMEEFVAVLSKAALSDADFAKTAALLASKVGDSDLMHLLIRPSLLKQMQSIYTQREEHSSEGNCFGLCVYLCELFRHLRLADKPLLPIADAVVDVLKGLINTEEPCNNSVMYFHQEFENVVSVLVEFAPEKLEELVDLVRDRLVMCTLSSTSRWRLVHLLELAALKWKMSEDITESYMNLHDKIGEGWGK